MATIKYYDQLGATSAFRLIGESGYLSLDDLVPDFSSYTEKWADNGTKVSQKLYLGTTLSYTLEYTYSSITSPAPDKIISQVSAYNGAGVLLENWSNLSLSLKEVMQTSAIGLFKGEDRIEGNASANYIQGALGDDLLVGLGGNDTLDGGRADDTLQGGAGNDTLYGGLGTDYAAFAGAANKYSWLENADGSITVTDTGSGFNEGADKLYDMEWLVFNYGTSSESKVLISQLVTQSPGYSLITGYNQVNPANLTTFLNGSNIIVDGNRWTFRQDTHVLSWALADNGYVWTNKETVQDIIGGALEEYTKVANINFQYIGSYSSVANAKAGGADFIYTLQDLGTSGVIAQAFFPDYTDRTIDYNYRVVNQINGSSLFGEFLSFVTIHETGHTLGLKHPHDASALNPLKTGSASVGYADGYSTLYTVMSYYNETGTNFTNSYYAVTPMYFDVLALKGLYGSPTYRDAVGDTQYSLTSKHTYQTIVDFSGVNTLDARAATEGWYIQLEDAGVRLSYAQPLAATYPKAQVVLGSGYFTNAKGTSYDDAIVGTSNANTISAGAGNDFVRSYGGGDSIDGGSGLDTLVFTEHVADLVISSASSDTLSFTKNASLFATVTGFENYRFGYGTSLSKDITAAQLKAHIVDSPATINTTITGVAKENERLGLKVAIADADGVGTYGSQWQSKASSGAWADMSGQSDGYLLLTQSQVNQMIRAKVSYIDAQGHAQTAYSSATASVLNVNDLPTGSVSVSGNTVAGELLTADASLIRDEDGLGTFAYQWQRSADGSEWEAISGATASTYRIVEADAFKSMRVVVSYVDGFNTAESVTSTSTAVVNPSNFVATGAPVIQLQGGVAIEDSRMSVDMSAVADRNGLGAFSYQWQKLSNAAWVSVPDAKLSAFTPTDAEVGQSLRLQASFVDGRGNLETVYSAATAAIQNVNDAPTGGIRLNGSHIENATLTVESTLSDDDGLGALSYQWQVSSNKTTWTNVSGATAASFRLSDAQVGSYVRVSSTYVDGHVTTETVVSDASTLIRNVNDTPGGAVLLSGLAKEDQTLTANATSVTDADGLSVITMQWQYESATGAWADILGAKANTLTLGDAQVGKSVRATAQFTDLHGTNEIVASYGTVKVENVNDAPTGSVRIDGKLALGSTLSANTSGVSDADGILVVTDGIYEIDAFTYLWQRSSNGTVWSDIAGATEADYVLTSDDLEQKVRVKASYTDLHGTDEQVASAMTTAVPTVNSNPVGSVTLSGTATENMTLQVNTGGLSDADGLGAFRYQWQRSSDGTDWFNIGDATASSYVLGDDDVANVVRAAVTYTDGHNAQEMVFSSSTAAVIGVNDAPTGGIKVTGQFFQGGIVSADTSNLHDNDGLGALKYQWQRSADGTTYTNISAATEKSFELTKFEVDDSVRVIVSYKDGQGFRESISSSVTQKILDTNDAPSGVATLSGIATEDKILSINTTSLADDDGIGGFQYAWQVSKEGDVWGSRPGAFAGALELDDQDVGLYVRGVVKYVDGHGNYETVYSQSIGPVGAVNDAPLGDISITGLLSSGQTLTVDYSDVRDVDGLGVPSFDWHRAGSATGTWTKIATTALPNYTLTTTDVSQYLRVDLKYTDQQGFVETISTKTGRTILGGVVGRTPGDLVSGSIKDDYITATAQDDNINAGAGNDQIDAGKGADVIDAGSGNDAIYLEPDGIWAGGFKAARIDYPTSGASSIAEYVLIDGRNRFYDVIDGNTGFDTIVLSETYNGDAFFLHDFFSDFNAGKTSAFVVDNKGNSGTSRMGGVERILGGQGDDIIDITSPTFTVGDIELQGNQGADVLWGGDGNDTLDGGAGSDTLAGGRGADQFVLRDGESNASIALADHIRDFRIGEDKFALSGGLRYADLAISSVTDTDGSSKLAIKSTNGQAIYALLDNLTSANASALGSSSFISYAKDEKISLTGAATEDQTLSLDVSSVQNKAADAPLRVKWQMLDTQNGWETLSESAATTLTLGQAQVGHAVRAVASYSDIYGFERTYATEPTASVLNVNDAPQGALAITGKLTVGQALFAGVGGITDEDGLGDFSVTWQASSNSSAWTNLSGVTGPEFTIDSTLVGKTVRAKATYLDGGGTTETVYSAATDPLYGFTGQKVVFAKNDDPTVYNIKVDQDLKRANSFAFDFDFTYDSSKVVSSFSGKDTIADIELLPTKPNGTPLIIKLGSAFVDVAYDQWAASAGSALVGDVAGQDHYTLTSGVYKAHIELKTVNNYQDFIAVVSKYGADTTLSDVGMTSVSLSIPAFSDSRDFNLYVDGSYDTGVASLDHFKLALTRIPQLFEEFEGTPDADTLYGTSMQDVMYGFEGNDSIYGLDGNDTLYGGEGNDLIGGGRGDDSIDGGLGNDILLGESGDDTLSGGGGRDTLLGGLGNDTITVGGNGGAAFATTVDGGSGADRLNIAYAGIGSLGDFAIGFNGTTTTLTDINGGVINFGSIESLYVNNHKYNLYPRIYGPGISLDNWPFGGQNLIWGVDEKTIYALPDSSTLSTSATGSSGVTARLLTNLEGFATTDNLHYVGSTGNDYFDLSANRLTYTGSFTLNMGDGNDLIASGKLIATDSINLGAGDDVIFAMSTNLTTLSVSVLDGGSGTDMIDFQNSTTTNGQILSLNTANATHFENLTGGYADEILQGDAGNNVLQGTIGSDTLYGFAGNDTLVGDWLSYNGIIPPNYAASSRKENDQLYGGDGNDLLIGTAGDNLLDGGAGADTSLGGAGIDTFVLRSGDGGNTIAGADVIKDFQDGTDVLGLAGSLTYNNLIISQGNGTDTSTANTVIKTSTEFLAILLDTQYTKITLLYFQQVL